MRSLLDATVLIALLDQQHLFHARAWAWLTGAVTDGWASCPITQASFVRIISHPRYPGAVTTPRAIAMLAGATGDPSHEFWPDDLSLSDPAIDRSRLLGSGQLTDAYLLALAVAHSGQLVTFDRDIDLSVVPAAVPANLFVL